MAAHFVWLVGNRFDNSVCVCVYVYHLTLRKPHMLTTDMIEIIQAYPLGLVASIRSDGWPAVSPKGTFFLVQRTNSFWIWYDVTAPNRDTKSSCQGRGEIFCRCIFWAVQGPMSVNSYRRPITNSLFFNSVY